LPGRFATTTNGETFPIALENYCTLRGASRESTTVDAENRSRVFEGRDLAGSVITDLMTNCLLQNNSAAHHR
jgi:hypothetical protein